MLPSAVVGQEGAWEPGANASQTVPSWAVSTEAGRRHWGCSALFGFLGLSSGPAHQISPLPRPVQHLPYQALLHLQHPHHPAIRPGIQSICHLPDAVSPLQWQPASQPAGHLVCKYGAWIPCLHVSFMTKHFTQRYFIIVPFKNLAH